MYRCSYPGIQERNPRLKGAEDAQESLSSSSTTFLWIIISWGALLRLIPYLFNRSLWLDESMLALNVINRSFFQLLKPLDYNQGSPLGFLMLERLAVQVFGTSEYTLRLFPLFCGILSILLFYRLAKLCVTPKAVPIALGLFAISGPLVYYSSEAKQYSSDVAIALLLFSAAIYYKSRELTPRRIAGFGLLGAASVWFSHPSLFILAGIGTSLTLFCLAGKGWTTRIGSLAIVYSAWALSFACCYLISLRQLSNNQALLYEWSFGFVPSPLLSLVAVDWFINAFFVIFRKPVGLELTGIAVLTFLVGCISMFSNKREELFILMSPILLVLLAAGFHKYPFSARMLLFIVPGLLLFIAEGAEEIRCRTRDETPIIGACVIGLLFFHPLLSSSYQLIKPSTGSLPLGVQSVGHTREEIKPVMNYVKEHGHEGDVLYVFDGAKPAFLYYAPKYRLNEMNYVLGRASAWTDHWEDYEKDIDQLRGHRRVWLLNTHIRGQEEKFFLYLLDRRGTRLDYFKSVGAIVYLYDLDQLKPSTQR